MMTKYDYRVRLPPPHDYNCSSILGSEASPREGRKTILKLRGEKKKESGSERDIPLEQFYCKVAVMWHL